MACVLLAACGAGPGQELQSPSTPVESAGISRDDAVEAALDAAGAMVAEDWQPDSVIAGPLGEVLPDRDRYDWARNLPSDLQVWRVGLVSGDLSALVVTDFIDGTAYGVVVGIAN